MSLKDRFDQLLNRIRTGDFFGTEEQEAKPNLANGGYTGYRPGWKDPYGTQSLQISDTAEPMPARSGRESQVTGHQTGYAQFAPQGGMPPFAQMPGGMEQGGFEPYAQDGRTAYMPPESQTAAPGGQFVPFNQQPQLFPPQQAPQQQSMTQQGTTGNLLYLNTPFADETGRGYRHLERVVQLTGVAACFRIIEFMRNGESVIVNTESIPNDADIQRCLDMLAGAAFTLSCSLTKITGVKRAYLIAPSTVLVLQDGGTARMSEYQGEEMRATGTNDSRGFGRRARY